MHQPRLAGVLFRIVFLTFLSTLLTFAITLLGSIIGLVILGELHGGLRQVNMTIAYRHIALPVAVTVGAIALITVFAYEMRRYFRMRALARLEERL